MTQLHAKNIWFGIGVVALSALVPLSTNAQSVDLNARPAEFTADSAIVDTAIPFAIGASEARQSLRGAFGWPTFQEGLVEGVYFRFDPDGYARFSPNPRLDVDVFEVLCKARTKDCHARKAGLTVLLTARGQLQLAVEGVIAGDSFFLSEGVSEIQVPERVLQPLDVQLEHLLSSSLELVVRRGGEEVSRHSLRGFLAATAYLRWIANNQDYAVLPRDWPVPNGRQVNDAQRLTQNATWQSPMPQPQVIAITSTPAASAPLQGEADRIEAQLEDLRGMLETLRSTPPSATDPTQPSPLLAQAIETTRLEQQLRDLAAEVQTLRESTNSNSVAAGVSPTLPKAPPLVSPPEVHEEDTRDRTTDKLAYLVEELGLDLRSAVAVLELAEGNSTDMFDPLAPLEKQPDITVSSATMESAAAPQVADDVVADELEPVPVHSGPQIVTVAEYTLLSDYFRSAVLPALQADMSSR